MCHSSLRPVSLNVPGEPKDTKEFEEIRTTISSINHWFIVLIQKTYVSEQIEDS